MSITHCRAVVLPYRRAHPEGECRTMANFLPFFVYGTLMTGYANHRAIFESLPLNIERASVRGSLYHLPEGYPALLPGKEQVYGELITPRCSAAEYAQLVNRMDELEGFGGVGEPDNLYNREALLVETAQGSLRAYGYLYVDTEYAQERGTHIPHGDWRRYIQPSQIDGTEPLPKVVVDADACPKGALLIMRRLQREYGFRLITVASFNHNIEGTEHITVGDGPDEADLAIVNQAAKGDIVVTQDWGLAALVLAKGGRALSPKGHEYTPTRIEFLLDERHIKAKIRRSGGRTRGPSARTTEDDERFEAAFRRLLEGRQ